MASFTEFSPQVYGLASLLFGLAILHTFLVSYFHGLAKRLPPQSVGANLFKLLGEVEIVFGLWAAVLLGSVAIGVGSAESLNYLESRNFNEPIFVFVILVVCATQPVLEFAESLMNGIARVLPFGHSASYYATLLTVGPLLGSFITEPAAMTLSALLILEHFFKRGVSTSFKYATLAVLFVNISIGGTLTPFAAPPVLMVAAKWGWGMREMFFNFGWKGAVACLVSTAWVTVRFKKDLSGIRLERKAGSDSSPFWIQVCHLAFLAAVVVAAHHSTVVIGIFLIFLGFVQVTSRHQEDLRLKEGLLVSFFLGGLVVLGGLQGWWLQPLLSKLTALPLYLGAIGLTAFTDNAALTYLGTLVPDLTEASRLSLVSGAVVGGGLTVIANAPNPAGYSILQGSFGPEGIRPLLLFTHALIPTAVAAACFWFL